MKYEAGQNIFLLTHSGNPHHPDIFVTEQALADFVAREFGLDDEDRPKGFYEVQAWLRDNAPEYEASLREMSGGQESEDTDAGAEEDQLWGVVVDIKGRVCLAVRAPDVDRAMVLAEEAISNATCSELLEGRHSNIPSECKVEDVYVSHELGASLSGDCDELLDEEDHPWGAPSPG